MKTRPVIVRVVPGVLLAALVAGAVWYVRTRPPVVPIATSDAGPDAGPAEERQRPVITDRPGPGDVRLAGSVFDVAGNPVADVEITAAWELGPGVKSLARTIPRAQAALADAGPGASPPGQSDAAPASRDVSADASGGLDLTPEVTAVSRPDGTFELVGLVAGRYRLRIEGKDIFSSEVRFFDVPADGVRLVVARKTSVRGKVVDGQKTAAAGVTVHITGEGVGGTMSTQTGAGGEFAFDTLQEGVFQVWAAAGDRAAAAVRVARLGPGPFPDVELLLGPAAIVTGRVIVRDTGRGVAAAVTLRATSLDEPTRYGESDPGGNFRIEGVPLGRWSAEAFATGYVTIEAIDFDVARPFVPVIELWQGGAISGRVIDSRGVPIPGAAVSATGIDAAGRPAMMSEARERQRMQRARGSLATGWQGSQAPSARFVPRGELGVLVGPIPYPPPPGSAALRIAERLDRLPAELASKATQPLDDSVMPRFVTDSDGRFRITGLEPGSYRLIAVHADHADGRSKLVPVALGKSVDNVEIVLVPGVVLVGEVSNTRGELVVGADLVADVLGSPRPSDKGGRKGERLPVLAGEDATGRLQAVTGLDGRYRLGPIAQAVSVRVTAVRHGDVERTIPLGELTEQRVERTEDFVLPVADAEISGQVVDAVRFPVRDASLRIEGGDRGVRGRQSQTNQDGRFVIGGLPAGTYRVAIAHPQFPAQTAMVTTGKEATLTLPFGGGIAGEVRDAHNGEPVAGARIQASGPGGSTKESAAGQDGAVTLVPLVPGSWTLVASAPGWVRSKTVVDVPAGREPGVITVRDVRLVLARGALVAGVVRNALGERVRGAQVRVGEVSGKTDENGEFRLRDVPTGESTVIEAERDGVRGKVTVALHPGDEVVTLDIRLGE